MAYWKVRKMNHFSAMTDSESRSMAVAAVEGETVVG